MVMPVPREWMDRGLLQEPSEMTKKKEEEEESWITGFLLENLQPNKQGGWGL